MYLRKSIFYACLMLLFFSACKSEIDFVEASLRPGQAEASFSGGNLSVNFAASAGSASVDLTASGGWTAAFVNDRAKDWCSISTSEGGRGTVTITVSVKENPDYDERSASINFVCGDVKRTITVMQKQKDGLLVTSKRLDVDQPGGRITVEVKANVSFDYAVSDNAKSWIRPVGTKALTTSVLSFDVAANETVEKREGEIVVTASTGSEVVKVYQAGETPTLILSQNRYELTSEASEITVEVQHNVNVEMEIPTDCDWIVESKTKSMSTSSFHLVVSENETFTSRSCRLKFRSSSAKLEEELVIEQAAATPQLFIGEGVYEFDAAGGDLSIDVTSNFGVTVSVPDTCSWIKIVGTKALTTKTWQFVVEENETLAERSGVIVFSNASLGIKEQVVIRQRQQNTVIVSEKYFEIPAEGGQVEVQVSHNIEYWIHINKGWIHQMETKSMTTDVLHFAVDANDDLYAREGMVMIGSERGIDTLLFVQDHEAYWLRLKSPESRELSHAGGILTLVLEHSPYAFRETQCYFENEFGASFGDNYVFAYGSRRYVRDNPRQTTVTVQYTKNPLRRVRKGYVMLSVFDSDQYDTLVFTQPPLTILTSDSEVFIPAEASTFTFRVAGTDPGAYRVEKGPFSEWIQAEGTQPSGGETLYRWRAEPNTGRAMRAVDIKIYPVKGGWPDVFRICQEGSGLSVSVTYSLPKVKAPAIYGPYREHSTIWWGDGTSQPFADGATHNYSGSGRHTVTVRTNRMEYIDWAEVSSFENGMHIDFSKIHVNK